MLSEGFIFPFHDNMNETQAKLEKERNELNTLINKGVTFDVQDVEFRTEKRLFGLVRKRVPETITRTFKISELTLATLDRLSAEWVEMAIDEAAIQTTDGMKRARTMAKEHAVRCARVLAIAVLGEERLVARPCKGGTQWVEDTKRVEELTALFARTIKPSQLYQLYMLVNAMGNLGDFLNSIRLMQTERTTPASRIEENNAG